MSMFQRIIFILAVACLGISYAPALEICPLPQHIKPKGLPSLAIFKKIVVFDQGRIKPLDTYARNLMIQFSGRNSFNQEPAVKWLAKLLFAPDTTRQDKVFRANNTVVTILKIAPNSGKLYSYAEIEPGLQKLTDLAETSNTIEQYDRNSTNHDILSLYGNVVLYTNLANSFAFAIPHPDFQVNSDKVARLLNLPHGKNVYSFFDVAVKSETIMAATDGIDQTAIDKRTAAEKELLRLLGNLFRWSMYYENNVFRIIPTSDPRDDFLMSPWEAINTDFKKEEIQKELRYLRDVVVYYWNGEQLQFDMTVRLFQNSIMNRIDSSEAKNFQGINIKMEILNNQFNPLSLAKLFYGFSFLLFMGAVFFKQRFLKYLSFFFVSFGFILHSWAVITLSVIMKQPPWVGWNGIFFCVILTGFLGCFIFIGLKKRRGFSFGQKFKE